MGEKVEGTPLDELPLSEKKQQFSLAFVRMVVAAAGCSVKCHETDYDGVDITIASSAEYARYYCPQFELQLKCTSQLGVLRDTSLMWQMKAGPFRRLTNPKRHIPAYLGVLHVPESPESWLHQNEERLLVNSKMYWENAANLGVIAEGQASKTVRLPKSNLFDVDRLLGIMKTIGEGGDW
ncbi:DUF4365 domain-containing protein [Acrocarpospora catenulata]|uniref:DUF4365 domain-containing protein n=1 Tax=Acrocarpospora catenulata TaxID=2836182 RepID=UPI002023B276|nr:DUF4365 domain-containing protein [Acrocarpospora catenulata]